jgi:hypothetical protein
MQIDHKCAHKPCECMISSDQEYCSESCRYNDNRQGSRGAEEECDCGHKACAEDGQGASAGLAT